METLKGFERVDRKKMLSGWSAIAREFNDSTDDCVMKDYGTLKECERARTGINEAARRMNLPIRAHRRGSCLYLAKEKVGV